MLSKHIAASLMATAMLATTAIAQTPPSSSPSMTPSVSPAPAASSNSSATSMPAPTPSANISAASSTSYQGNWRTSKVVGLNVYNDKDESLGEINDLLTDKQGKIVAAIIGVGGFLGVGERYAAVPFEKLKFVNDPRASVSANAANRPATTTGTAPGSAATGSAATGTQGAGSSTMTVPATPVRSASNANDWAPDHAVLNVSKDEIKNMAEFKYTK